MTNSKRVQDRSRLKRVHDLELATEKWKVAYKVLFLIETLKQEPEMIIPVRNLEQYRRQINLPKPHKVSDFIRKSPKLFELYKDQRGVLWCGMTKQTEDLVEEEEKLIEQQADKAAEYVTRFLMMSVNKRLPVDKIAHFRRDFGLPLDFRAKWVNDYPELFKMVKSEDECEYLELVSWNPAWAVTELERKFMGVTESTATHTPGLLSLPFPLKFPSNYKKMYRYGGKIDHFQKRSYLSPYADARGLQAGSLEFDKRAVAVMHELLSFTMEKRLVTDHLTHFRRELVMPQKLMRLLLKHIGIFYVSERGKRFSVFLTEAYEGPELIDKCPLVLWKEKVLSLVGYRGKKKKIETFDDISEMEDDSLGLAENDPELDMEDTGCSEETALDVNTIDTETRDLLSG
ncbi:protein WHAT'S THIS FACTOR 1 homolog, chloroplastic isoform X2 [Benincasa hispida]|nr:protein WHAT'S THIS FACTOR 1 homolog, chloroplastic isoform X2 [Benincasa hispida]